MLTITLIDKEWEEEREAVLSGNCEAISLLEQRLYDLACSVVGHKPVRHRAKGKEWVTCCRCYRLMSGHEPNFDDMLVDAWGSTYLPSHQEAVSPFYKALSD